MIYSTYVWYKVHIVIQTNSDVLGHESSSSYNIKQLQIKKNYMNWPLIKI